MRFKEILTELGDKHSRKDIDKAIKSLTPSDFKKGMRSKKDNVIINIIKKKLKSK